MPAAAAAHPSPRPRWPPAFPAPPVSAWKRLLIFYSSQSTPSHKITIHNTHLKSSSYSWLSSSSSGSDSRPGSSKNPSLWNPTNCSPLKPGIFSIRSVVKSFNKRDLYIRKERLQMWCLRKRPIVIWRRYKTNDLIDESTNNNNSNKKWDLL